VDSQKSLKEAEEQRIEGLREICAHTYDSENGRFQKISIPIPWAALLNSKDKRGGGGVGWGSLN